MRSCGRTHNEMKVWNFVDPARDDADIPMRDRENPPNVYGFGHAAYLEHVVDTVLKTVRRSSMGSRPQVA